MNSKKIRHHSSIQKQFYLHIKKKALSLESGKSPQLKSYLANQKKFLARPFDKTSINNLLKSVEKSEVVYIGDFHTFDQSSKNMERLVLLLLEERAHGTDIYLGMEMVQYQFQSIVNQFLEGLISEDEMLDSIDYHQSWRFPWIHYRSFFELAKKHKLKILALNSVGGLKERDNLAAKLICRELAVPSMTPKKVFVLFGESHIFPNKLPMQVSKISKEMAKSFSPLTQTIIHQNLDDVYWKLSRHKNITQMKELVVAFDTHEYCLLTSPPWVKYESMVYWFENLSDDPEFDLHSANFEQGLKKFTENSHDTFLYLINHLSMALLPTSQAEDQRGTDLSDFNLYDATKLEYLEDKTKNLMRKTKNKQSRVGALASYIMHSFKKGRPFPIPGTFHYYLPSYSFNRLAQMAGVHLYTNHRGKGILRNQIERGSAEGRFTYFLYMEMLSYYCSKIVNPFRKCDLYVDLVKKSRTSQIPQTRRERIKLALKLLTSSQHVILKSISHRPAIILHDIARILGPLLSEMAFAKYHLKIPKNSEIFEIVFNGELEIKSFIKIRDLCCLDLAQLKASKKRFF